MSFKSVFRIISVLWLSTVSVAFAQIRGPVEVTAAVQHDVSEELRNIPPRPPQAGQRVIPVYQIPHALGPAAPDPVLQTQAGSTAAPATGMGFDGVGKGFSGPNGSFSPDAAPPDTNGAVGSTQYVQWVNESFAVFDKATGAAVYGPAAGNTLWSGFGGKCETNNDGDPIVQYDKAANRWIMTQFAVTGTGGYLQCVAVSRTGDATGTWNRYSFSYRYFNDYPKVGVWPDAYYVTFNMFQGTFVGPYACAWDRAKMLAGLAATQVCFQFTSSVGSLLPADLDGVTAPPPGSPNYLVTLASNALNLYKFHVDFSTPTNSTVTGPFTMSVAAFSKACGGGACIPQLGTSQLLASLADRLMYRLAYRNFGDHESLVVNHSIATTNAVGVRWYELRNPSGTPVVYQQGTYAPDSEYRWMGSIAMDKAGNMALGYSISSSTRNPSINYTVRSASDALGQMGSETQMLPGTGSQLPTLNRWGDYSAMSIDPVDDCTFWYTTEYLKQDGTFNWSTRIGSFQMANCGTPAAADFNISATPASATVTQGANASYTVSITPQSGFSGSASLSVSGLPAGATANFNPLSISPAQTSTLTVTTSGVAAGTYTLTITGTSGTLTHSTTVTLVVNAAGDFTITVAAPSSRSALRGDTVTYSVTVTPVGSFTADVSLSVSGLPNGSSATFNPATIAGGSQGTSMITVKTSKGTKIGTYTLTITGTGGGKSYATTVTLSVN